MADTNLWSNILDTTGSLIGLGKQSLINDGEKIKADAAKELVALQAKTTLSTQEYNEAMLKIQTDRDAKLSALKVVERKQLLAGGGVLLVILAATTIVILLVVRSPRRAT